MAIIYSYPQPAINTGMLIIGSDTTQTGNPTVNIGMGALAEFVLAYFNNNGTPNTHAMFITNTTIGDSYINQTAPGATSASLYSNEDHEMKKYLVCSGNVYIGAAGTLVDKVLTFATDTEITTTNYTISTTTSQKYYGIENHYFRFSRWGGSNTIFNRYRCRLDRCVTSRVNIYGRMECKYKHSSFSFRSG